MRSAKCLLTALFGVSAIAGAAFGQSVARDLPPVSLRAFGPGGSAPLTTVQGAASEELGECRVWWDNGNYDGVTGLNSQELSSEHGDFSALVADDFFLKFGRCYYIESIELDMAVFGVEIPEVILRLYNDCSGKPDTQKGEDFIEPIITDLGELADWPGFTHYRFRFVTELFEYGYQRLWLSPVGQGKGLYYWLSSNNGVVQGVQGQYKSAAYNVPDWTDVDAIGDDCPSSECQVPCTDFNFRLCGKCCWLIKDNTPHDLAGLASIAFSNGIVFGSRSVDNFQIPPGKDVEVCKIEGWLATNCDRSRVFMEIYNNDCDTPVKPAAITITDLKYEATGELFNGIPVYRFYTVCPGVILQGGQNYWLAIASIGLGTPHERSHWLFKALGDCHINITEGQYKNIFLAGVQNFTPVSEIPTNSPTFGPGIPRDFAFRLYTAEPEMENGTPPSEEEPAPTNVGSPAAPTRTLKDVNAIREGI